MNIPKAFKKPAVIVGIALLIILLVLSLGGEDGPVSNIVTVERVDLAQTVSVTGRVVPSEEASLAFERGGKFSAVYANVGSLVSRGSILAQLENADLSASVLQAKASLAAAEARYAEVARGARPEDISISEAKVVTAERSLADARQQLFDAIRQLYTYADDAVRNKTDQLFSNATGKSPTLAIPVSDFQLKTDIESLRFGLSDRLLAWAALIEGSGAAEASLLSDAAASASAGAMVKAYLDKVAAAVNALTTNSSLSQTTIDAYKASVSTARTNVNANVDALNTASGAVSAADAALTVSSRELSLKKAGATPEALAIEAARVSEARAVLLSAEAQLGKTYLRAPFAGVVTKVDARVGEIAPANTPVVWLIGQGQFEIEANVPEADIAKISLLDAATTTLDAYSSDIFFPASVSEIDPAETIVDNVATYKITLRFLVADPRIRSGMTANIDIMTDMKQGVLAVPARAVIGRSDGSRIVNVVSPDGSIEERVVEAGIRGEGGLIEIVTGLSEGEQVRLGL